MDFALLRRSIPSMPTGGQISPACDEPFPMSTAHRWRRRKPTPRN